jgi:hypothetical protein
MLYWLFTTGRGIAAELIFPLLCLTALMPLIASAMLGVGIQRTSEPQTTRREVIRLLAFVIVLAGITALYVTLLGDLAVQPARGRQTTNGFIRALTGGPNHIDRQRLFLFGMMLCFLWMLTAIGLHSGLRNGGWLREWVDRFRRPRTRRGALGSSHFCTMREYRRFRREDAEGLTLLGAFWDGDRRRLDIGSGRFCLNGEDIARGMLTIGGPGSGKTQGIILPAIADRMLAGHSLIIADPQGELTDHIQRYAAVTRSPGRGA